METLFNYLGKRMKLFSSNFTWLIYVVGNQNLCIRHKKGLQHNHYSSCNIWRKNGTDHVMLKWPGAGKAKRGWGCFFYGIAQSHDRLVQQYFLCRSPVWLFHFLTALHNLWVGWCNTYGAANLVLHNDIVWWFYAWLFWLVDIDGIALASSGLVQWLREANSSDSWVGQTSVGRSDSFTGVWTSYRCHLQFSNLGWHHPKWCNRIWRHLSHGELFWAPVVTVAQEGGTSALTSILDDVFSACTTLPRH